jgi:hypothetical protein
VSVLDTGREATSVDCDRIRSMIVLSEHRYGRRTSYGLDTCTGDRKPMVRAKRR